MRASVLEAQTNVRRWRSQYELNVELGHRSAESALHLAAAEIALAKAQQLSRDLTSSD